MNKVDDSSDSGLTTTRRLLMVIATDFVAVSGFPVGFAGIYLWLFRWPLREFD